MTALYRLSLLLGAASWCGLASRDVQAQDASKVLPPATAAHCAVDAPPDAVGLYATPGGFVMVFPRNDAIGAQYTGCKTLWIVDVDRTPKLATLYFERGALKRAIAYDVRSPTSAIDGACEFPEGRSLLPTAGRQYGDGACKGFQGEELYGVRVPTWPRSCLTKPDAAVCKADPR